MILLSDIRGVIVILLKQFSQIYLIVIDVKSGVKTLGLNSAEETRCTICTRRQQLQDKCIALLSAFMRKGTHIVPSSSIRILALNLMVVPSFFPGTLIQKSSRAEPSITGTFWVFQ